MSKIDVVDYAAQGDIPNPAAGNTGLAAVSSKLYQLRPDGTKQPWLEQTDLDALQTQIDALDGRVDTLETADPVYYPIFFGIEWNGDTTIDFGVVGVTWTNTMVSQQVVANRNMAIAFSGYHSYKINSLENMHFRLAITGSVSGGPFYTSDVYQTWQQNRPQTGGIGKINHPMHLATAQKFVTGETLTLQWQAIGGAGTTYTVNTSGEGDRVKGLLWGWN